jgi:hypothetical protein
MKQKAADQLIRLMGILAIFLPWLFIGFGMFMIVR